MIQKRKISFHSGGLYEKTLSFSIRNNPLKCFDIDVYDGSIVVDINTNSFQKLQFETGAFNVE